MIYATILICSAAFSPCSEDNAYRAVRAGEYRSANECFLSSVLSIPLVPHNRGDTFRIVCGGRPIYLGNEA